jgi:hypothetical protein
MDIEEYDKENIAIIKQIKLNLRHAKKHREQHTQTWPHRASDALWL